MLAQRLIRKLCPECKSPFEENNQRTYRAVGCGACNFSGYRGRTGIYELLITDDEMRRVRAAEARGALNLPAEQAKTLILNQSSVPGAAQAKQGEAPAAQR